ncbi:MAG: hypothetical protein WC197_00780, partial [Candidatus Gastranaerophilaceae bacterium]
QAVKILFLKSFVNTFQKNFKNVGIFKADYSDKIFYKTFFNYDKRIIDITNAIFFASDTLNPVIISQNCNDFVKNFDAIGLENIHMYAQDLFKKEIYTTNIQTLTDDKFELIINHGNLARY